jgi:hypothetical protein
MIKSPGTRFFIFLVIYQIAFLFLLIVIRPWIPDLFSQTPWFIILMQLLTLLLPLAIWLAIKKERLSDHMPNMKLGSVNGIMVIFISFFLLPFMGLLSGLSALFTPNVASDVMGQMQSHSIWVMLLAVAVTPAIVEEVVFRGYIQSQYPKKPFWQVALLNGFFFGLIHMNFQQFFYAFAMGIIMAYMVYYTRSIRAGIIAHFFMNGFNIVMFRFATWFLDRAEEYGFAGLEEAAELAEVSPLDGVIVMGILALVFLPFVIILFKAFISHNKSRMTVYSIRQALNTEEDENENEKSN